MSEEKTSIPVHIWTIDDHGLKVIRQKEPRFVALYIEGNLSVIQWLDEKPTEEKIISLLKKANAFLKHKYFNN